MRQDDQDGSDSDSILPPRRDVHIFGFLEHENEPKLIAGFYSYRNDRYPTLWTATYAYCEIFLHPVPPLDWSMARIFDYNVDTQQVGALHENDASMVLPGNYIMLGIDNSTKPLQLRISDQPRRRRVPTPCNTTSREHYWTRTRDRDGSRCLITGRRYHDWAALAVAHIYPRAYDAEWVNKGFDQLITDPGLPAQVGGPSRIDSIQNIITLRSDLHGMWDNYQIGINVDDEYRVIVFISGQPDIHGKRLKLSHIQDVNIKPLDALLKDHFAQCVLTHIRGAGEQDDGVDGHDFEPEAMDLSDTNKWTCEPGKDLFELALRDRLHGAQVRDLLSE